MSDELTPMDAYIKAAADVVDLPIASEYQPGVRQFLMLAHEMAQTLDEVPLDSADGALAATFRLPDAG